MKEERHGLTKEANFCLQLTPEPRFKILALHCESSSLELRDRYHGGQVLNGQATC